MKREGRVAKYGVPYLEFVLAFPVAPHCRTKIQWAGLAQHLGVEMGLEVEMVGLGVEIGLEVEMGGFRDQGVETGRFR